MDPSARYRPMSPAGKRMIIDPMRASTGTVPLSSYDPYEVPAARYAYNYNGYPSDPSYVIPHHSHTPRETRLEAHPVSSTAYRDPGNATKLKTEYAIRPRQRSSTTSAADIHHSHSPLRLTVPSALNSRQSPVVSSSYGRTPSPLPPASERYVVPASSRHGRHNRMYSYDYSSDTGRLGPNQKLVKHSMPHHGGNPAYHHNSRWQYPTHARKGEDIDACDAYSYTNPREEFEKNATARLNYGRAHRHERPLSLTGIEDVPPLPPRREQRALGPPPSSRGFDKIDRDGRARRSNYDSADSDAPHDSLRVRRRSHQRPVSVHHDNDGYSSLRDDHDGHHHSQHRRRHRHRTDDEGNSRQPDERVARKSGTDSAVARSSAGLGTAGLAAGYSDDFDYELSPRTDHRRSLEPGIHRDRPKRPSRRRAESDSDIYTSDEDLRKYRREPPAQKPAGSHASSSSSNQDQSSQHLTVDKSRSRTRRRSKSRPRQDGPPSKASSNQGSGSSQEDLKRAVTIHPANDLDAHPRGILKKPREKFPEEPNPVREGVAPLKDAHKKGIPPGARWTKVDRRLVNPAALEAGNERFEERSDYVIVLRVLAKEEIQAYAVKTQEIRDARQQEYLRDRRRRREEDRRRGRKLDDFSSDDEDEGDEAPPRAIEAPPA